jgi:5-methyltetrahydrofolate--homocysteine methyltransferase
VTLASLIGSGRTVVSDGATGTYLQARGLRPGACPELLNATAPDLIRGMAADYFAAGSDLVLTNSFGANRFRLEGYDLAPRAVELNTLAAELARREAPHGRFVVGSIGPTGVFLEPLGETTAEEMRAAFCDQATALVQGGVDGLLIETMSALDEAVIAVEVARASSSGAVMATMVFEPGPRGWRTSMGVSPEVAVPALRAAGADVVGANCGSGVDAMVELAAHLRSITDVPLIMHVNAGIPAIVAGRVDYPETPASLAPRLAEIARFGVTVVGGCCGTTPDHIRAFVSALRATS